MTDQTTTKGHDALNAIDGLLVGMELPAGVVEVLTAARPFVKRAIELDEGRDTPTDPGETARLRDAMKPATDALIEFRAQLP